MRVLVACHSAAPEALGGGERSLLALAKAWMAERAEDELIFLLPEAEGLMGPAVHALGHETVVIHSYPWVLRQPASDAARILRYQQGNAAAVEKIVALIEDRSIELVITNTIVNPWSAVAAAVTARPHVWFVREYGERDHDMRFQYGEDRTFEDIGALSDLVVTNSRAVEAFVLARSPESRVSVLYPSVDPREHSESDPFAGSPTLRVLALGKVSESKGQRDLVEAVALLRDAGVDVRATIVGPSNPIGYAAELRQLAESLGVSDRVDVLPPVDDPSGLHAHHDVGVTTSRMEAFGRVTLEYLQHGLPVVGARSGGTEELIDDDVNGFLYEPGSAAQLAAALSALADDPALRATLSAGALASLERIAAQTETMQSVISRIVETATDRPTRHARVPRFLIDQMAQAAVPAAALRRTGSNGPKADAPPATAARRRPESAVPMRERMILTAAAAGLVQRGYVDRNYYGKLAGRQFSSPYAAAMHFVRHGIELGLSPSPRLEPEWAAAGLGVTSRRVIVSLAVHGERAFSRTARPAGAGPDSTALAPSATATSEDLGAPFDDAGLDTSTFADRFGPVDDLRFADHPEVSNALSKVDWEAIRGIERVAGLTSVVMVAFRDWRLTLASVQSVLQNSGDQPIEVVVVDNGSAAHVRRILRGAFHGDERVKVLALRHNTYFSGGNNFGFAATRGDRVVFLNNDTTVDPGWLAPLLGALDDEGVRGAQPLLRYPDGLVQTAGTVFGPRGVLPWHFLSGHNQADAAALDAAVFNGFQAVTAACLVVRAEEFAAVDGFDELFANGMEDVDLCFRLVAARGGGFRTVTGSHVTHFEGAASGRGRNTTYNRQRFLDRWHEAQIEDDRWRYGQIGVGVAGFTVRDSKRGQEASAWGQEPIVVRARTGGPRSAFRLPYIDRAGSVSAEHADLAERFAAVLRDAGWTVAVDAPTQRYRRTRHLDDVIFHFATDKHPNFQPGAVNVVIDDGPPGAAAKNEQLVKAHIPAPAVPLSQADRETLWEALVGIGKSGDGEACAANPSHRSAGDLSRAPATGSDVEV